MWFSSSEPTWLPVYYHNLWNSMIPRPLLSWHHQTSPAPVPTLEAWAHLDPCYWLCPPVASTPPHGCEWHTVETDGCTLPCHARWWPWALTMGQPGREGDKQDIKNRELRTHQGRGRQAPPDCSLHTSMFSEECPHSDKTVTSRSSCHLGCVAADLHSRDSALPFQFVSGSLCCEEKENIYVLCPGSTAATTVLIIKRPEATVFTTLKKSWESIGGILAFYNFPCDEQVALFH